MTPEVHPAGTPIDQRGQQGPGDQRPAWERVAYTWLAREVDHGQPVDPATLAAEVSVAPGFAGDLLRVLRAHRQRDPALAELRARVVRDRITDVYLARELPGGERLDPAELAAEVGTTATVARQWLHTLRAGQHADRRLASLRAGPVSHGHPTSEQLAALQAAYAGGGRPQPEDLRPAGWALERIEQLYQAREVTRGQPLDPATVAREVGVSEHYVRGTLLALRGGTLTSAQRIEQLWQLWEVQGGQRLEFADLARIVGVREGRVRQILGPLRTAHRNTSTDRGERPAVVEDDGRQGWLDRAACRDLDPERFFPESGEQVKAAEAKAICAGCQVRDHCLELAVKAAGGLDADHGVFGGTLPDERSRLRGNTFPEPSAYRQDRALAEQAHALAREVGLPQAARQLGIHRDALKAAFAQWSLPAPERRVGWQPSRFLADRAEAERAFQLAERLGSVNAAAAELGTSWPSLRKAFRRHGLGMPARNPEAVRQRAVEAARQRSGRPATPALTRCLWLSTTMSCRSGRGRVGSLPSGCAAPRTTRSWVPGWWWSCTPKATRPSPAPAPGRSPAAPSVPTAATRTASSAATATVQTAPAAPTDPTNSPRRGGWLPMPADPVHPDQLAGEQRFRADLVAYLDSLPVGELAELLRELPSSRQEPLQLGVLMVALNERLPDAYKLLPPAGYPGPGEGRRRSLRQVVADRRAARTSRHPDAPAYGFAEWLADRQQQADLHAERARAGAVGERRVAEALRAWATDPDPAAGRQEPGDPPAERERGRQEQERDRQPEDDFGDSWHTYQERADHLRRTYGWTVPPPRRAEPWLPLGHGDDQEHNQPPGPAAPLVG